MNSRARWLGWCWLLSACSGATVSDSDSPQSDPPETEEEEASPTSCQDGAPEYRGDRHATWCMEVASGAEWQIPGAEMGVESWEQATPHVDLASKTDCDDADLTILLGSEEPWLMHAFTVEPTTGDEPGRRRVTLYVPQERVYVAGDSCFNEQCIDGAVATAFGFALGLNPPLEEGESGTPEEQEALMNQNAEPCVCATPCAWDLAELSRLDEDESP